MLKVLILFCLFVKVYCVKIGVIGCKGAVGKEIINCLYSQNIPISKLKLYSSKKSAGEMLKTPFGQIKIDLFDIKSARDMDINFIAVSGDFSKKFAKALSYKDGSIVIDNSSAFRLDPNVPLVIPEINPEKLKGKKLIANPNCTTAIALIALFPIFKKYGLEKIIMSTYQAASGAGNEGMKELENGVKDYASKNIYPSYHHYFKQPLPFNVIPQIDKPLDNGYSKEEMKVVNETKKIFDDDSIDISCTSVRVPTFRSHCESIILETKEKVDINELRELLSDSPGIKVIDNPKKELYPTPISSSNVNDIEVGRIRQNLIFGDKGIELFLCGDQLLRGAALNAVLICKTILKKN